MRHIASLCPSRITNDSVCSFWKWSVRLLAVQPVVPLCWDVCVITAIWLAEAPELLPIPYPSTHHVPRSCILTNFVCVPTCLPACPPACTCSRMSSLLIKTFRILSTFPLISLLNHPIKKLCVTEFC